MEQKIDIADVRNSICELKNSSNKEKSVLNLTANENITSDSAMQFSSSIWSNRYHLGTLKDYAGAGKSVNKGGLVFRGLSDVYRLEELAIRGAKTLFNSEKFETRYLSGVHAVMSNLGIFLKKGYKVMSFDTKDGGHFATQNIVKYFGGSSVMIPYDSLKQCIDIRKFEHLYRKTKPEIILFDHGVTLFPFNLAEVKNIVGDKSILIYDASHTLGLIAGKAVPNPISQGCSIVQANTHKSFPGPHKALSYWDDKKFDCINEALDCAFVSSQNTQLSIQLYITLLEMYFYSVQYANKMTENAKYLAKSLYDNGFNVMFKEKGFTETNVLLIKMPDEVTSCSFCDLLQRYDISTNARKLFGMYTLRIGVQEISRKGMGKRELDIISEIFTKIYHKMQSRDYEIDQTILEQVKLLTSCHEKIGFSFDQNYEGEYYASKLTA